LLAAGATAATAAATAAAVSATSATLASRSLCLPTQNKSFSAASKACQLLVKHVIGKTILLSYTSYESYQRNQWLADFWSMCRLCLSVSPSLSLSLSLSLFLSLFLSLSLSLPLFSLVCVCIEQTRESGYRCLCWVGRRKRSGRRQRRRSCRRMWRR
jgi:type IV secretory pathway VirB6-like protein